MLVVISHTRVTRSQPAPPCHASGMRLVIFAASAGGQRSPFGLSWRSAFALLAVLGDVCGTATCGTATCAHFGNLFRMNQARHATCRLSASFHRGGACVCARARVLKVRMESQVLFPSNSLPCHTAYQALMWHGH